MNEQYSRLDIESVFENVSVYLRRKVRFFLIGGCAMTFRNLKPSTKDVDLLFEEELSEEALFKSLTEIGFEELFPGSHELDLKAKDILINRRGLQFDLFTRTVMGGLMLSERMKKRAEKYKDYGPLSVFLASKEDIYLFKAITNRPFPRDYEDLITLQQTGLNWKNIIAEYKAQVMGRDIEKNLLKKLSNLREEGIVNPLTRKLLK
jgi:hypothetical protein